MTIEVVDKQVPSEIRTAAPLARVRPTRLVSLSYFSWRCRLSWSRLFPRLVNRIMQYAHLKGRSPVWVLMWTFKFPFSEKALLQPGSGQVNRAFGFRECLFSKWIRKRFLRVKLLPHYSQLNFPGSFYWRYPRGGWPPFALEKKLYEDGVLCELSCSFPWTRTLPIKLSHDRYRNYGIIRIIIIEAKT